MFILRLLLILFTVSCYASKSNDQWKCAGDVLEIGLPTAAFTITLGLRDFTGTKQFVKSFLATQITSYSLKYSIKEKRPRSGYHSFPSGHTATAFCASGFIQKRYGLKYGLPAHLLALIVGISRVKCKAHWTHDVIAGAAIGLGFSYLFTTPYHFGNFYFCPEISPDGLSITCEKEF